MAKSPEPDTRIDEAIDRVARRLTAGSPGSEFRARVLAGIDGPGPTSSGWHRGWRWSPVALVAAIILLAVIGAGWQARRVMAPTQARQAIVAVAAPPRRPVPMTTKAGVSGGALATVETALVAPEAPRAARRMAPRTALAIGKSPIDALAPAPLDVAPITIVALTPAESIQLSQMKISSIDVPRLARDGRPQD